jgi:hypothetical protein
MSGPVLRHCCRIRHQLTLLVERKAESPEGVKYSNVPGLLRTAGGVQHESTATCLDSGGLLRTS